MFQKTVTRGVGSGSQISVALAKRWSPRRESARGCREGGDISLALSLVSLFNERARIARKSALSRRRQERVPPSHHVEDTPFRAVRLHQMRWRGRATWEAEPTILCAVQSLSLMMLWKEILSRCGTKRFWNKLRISVFHENLIFLKSWQFTSIYFPGLHGLKACAKN